MVAIAHHNLGNARRELGQLGAAAEQLGAAVQAYRRFDDRWALGIVFEDVAQLAAQRGQPETALRLLGAAEAVRAELGSPRSPAQEESLTNALAGAHVATGSAAEALVASGRELLLAEATALAHQACTG
jgi:hypothetical protein